MINAAQQQKRYIDMFAVKTGGTVAAGKGKLAAKVDRDNALMYIGYSGQQVDDGLMERFESIAQACESTHQVSYVWHVEKIDPNRRFGELMPQVVLSGSGLVLEGADIARHLSGAKMAAIFACTLGQDCERELARLSATSPLDHVLYDCCASSLAEAGAHKVQELLAQEAASRSLCAHARFSPGYGDLPLGVQPSFLEVLGASRALGMSTTEQNFLLPTKSVTAIIGFFEEETDDSPSPCELCAAREYCCYRERGTTCHGR